MEGKVIDEEVVLGFCRGRFGEHLHDKRCRSVAYGILGVMHADEVSVAGVGRGMTRARNMSPKHCIIRFRGSIYVWTADGQRRRAAELVATNRAAIRHDNVELTQSRRRTEAIVTVHDTGMKEPWFLATSLPDQAQDIVTLYSRRFTLEETFRDTKDPHFGMGLSQTHIGRPDRRDRMLMLLAVAHALLTFLGRAGETLGLDQKLKANTVRRRTHSLFRQGREYLRGIVGSYMRDLSDAFLDLLRGHPLQTETYAWI